MSDHFDADDGRVDLTDVYVFPGARGRTVLVACFNPDPEIDALNVDPDATYELKLDTDGDAIPDLAFHVGFEATDGNVTATVRRVTGAAAQQAGPIGEVIASGARLTLGAEPAVVDAGSYRFFAGVRSDPHFKDILGFRNNFQFTGNDPIANRNVVGIVLEIPNDDLGAGVPIRFWARTMAPAHGPLVQVDQAGRPGVNNTFNTEEEDNAAFCHSSPVDQVARFGAAFERFLRSLGYTDAEASALLPAYLPDWLVYDPTKPSGYPNGRRLTDDTADLLASLLTRGRITSDGIGPHTDLLDAFPYLGPPRPYGGPTV